MAVAVAAVVHTKPMSRLPCSCKAEWRTPQATGVLADVVFDPRLLTGHRRHAFGKS
jgi:hypothetical protein